MDRLSFETPDLIASNIAKIAALFPNVVTEVKDEEKSTPEKIVLKKAINFDLLRQELSGAVTGESEECYDFTWVGKKASMVEANTPIKKTLRPALEESKNWETTGNLYIEGDNLDVLKLLQENYLGKIKMIYIDPPYNTGNDFIYKDDFAMSREDYDEQIGLNDEEGNRLFQNSESNGRFHSDWCSMIYPRLKLAQNLLTDDGVIFISIDDNEVENLRKICDEIFGEENLVSCITWEKRFTRSNNSKMFASLTENILLYRKTNRLQILKGPRTEKSDSIYGNPDNDPRGAWTSVSYVNPATKEQRPNLVYKIINPFTGDEVVHPTNAWKYEYGTYQQHVNENKLYWGKKGENTYPRLKKFLNELDGGIVPVNLWYYKDAGTTDAASKDFESLMGRRIFDFPKPVLLINKMLEICTSDNDTVLDFFSGSATTAHAVMQLNAEDGGNRKFIMVQLPEPCAENSEAYKAGYKTICDIGKERIRRAGDKIKAEMDEQNAQLKLDEEPKKVPDIGFRVLKLDDTNMKEVYYSAQEYTQQMLGAFESNIKEDRTDLDLLYGCLLDWGLPLSLPHRIETVEGVRIHIVDENALVACFADKVSEPVVRAIAKRRPLRAVFRDSSFANSPDKINVAEIFKLLAPETTVKVI